MSVINWIQKNQLKVGILIVSVAVLVVIGGLVFLPDLFYDQWIWKYYWGPVVADADPYSSVAIHNGVVAQEGYTILSEATYGIILIAAIYAIYRLLQHLKVRINWQFALALLPYIIFGPTARALEDSNFFTPPVVYWFISPLIYVQIACYAIGFVLLGWILQRCIQNEKVTVNRIVGVGGLILLLPSVYYILVWLAGNQWSASTGVRYDVAGIVLVIICSATALLYAIGRFARDSSQLHVFQNPLNLAMFFGHLLDGVTSYISIKDPLQMGLLYSEKHPASNALLNLWGPSFVIVKGVLIVLIIYLFDIFYKDELRHYQQLVNLLKIGVLILGFSPGLRDILRVSMGV